MKLQHATTSQDLKASVWAKRSTSTSVFQDNQYIRQLNRLLQLELGAVSLYQQISESLGERKYFQFLARNHQISARQLVCIIISNGGIPEEEGFHLSISISLVLSRILSHLSSELVEQKIYKNSLQVEKSLRRRYHRCLHLCRRCDRISLMPLMQQVRLNIDSLEARLEH